MRCVGKIAHEVSGTELLVYKFKNKYVIGIDTFWYDLDGSRLDAQSCLSLANNHLNYVFNMLRLKQVELEVKWCYIPSDLGFKTKKDTAMNREMISSLFIIVGVIGLIVLGNYLSN
jgi:hypothetical protein